MTKPVVLLVHGWGFDAGGWAPLQQALGDAVETVAWDLGFRGNARRPAVPEGRPVVAVGHSLGLLWLLRERPLVWRALVSINGFPRFTRADDFPQGVAPRLLERMIARFGEAPQAVYADFMSRCGVAAPDTDGLAANMLADGLQALLTWDQRAGAMVDLVLAGRADPIVNEAMTLAAFPRSPIEWQDGGHLLPLTAPDWCAAKLLAFLETMG